MPEMDEDRSRRSLCSDAAAVVTVGDLRRLLDECGLPDAAPVTGLAFGRRKRWRDQWEETTREGTIGARAGAGELTIGVDVRQRKLRFA